MPSALSISIFFSSRASGPARYWAALKGSTSGEVSLVGVWICQCSTAVCLNLLKLGTPVQNFVTVLGLLCTNIDVVSPFCVQRTIINGLDFLVSVHLVFP